MNTEIFKFEEDEEREYEDFMEMVASRDYKVNETEEDGIRMVEVDDMSEDDKEYWEEYNINYDGEDDEDDYYEPADLEVGFNPYMGTYDYDC